MLRDSLNRSSATKVVQVTEPPKLTAVCTGKNIPCVGPNVGTASVQVTGGSGPYSFQWKDSLQTQTRLVIGAGVYSVTVTDSFLCAVTCSVAIVKLQPLTVKVTGTNPSCTGQSGTARVDTFAIGGTPPYKYSWGDGSTAGIRSGLGAGTYTVTVTDANGCKGTGSVTLTQQGLSKPKYKEGDSLMPCGYVVYVDTTPDLQHPCSARYLVCAFKDQSTGVAWHRSTSKYIRTNATLDVLFDKANARKIDSFSLAANTASKFSTDSCTGWYLPSRAELAKMYSNLAAKGKGNFVREGYWTSVESTNRRKAWTVDFIDGAKRVNDKATDNHVRAVCEIWIRND